MARTGSEIDQRNQSLLGHLVGAEKQRLVQALWFIVAGTNVTYSINEKVFEFIRKPHSAVFAFGWLGV